jgi:hypothetical protein
MITFSLVALVDRIVLKVRINVATWNIENKKVITDKRLVKLFWEYRGAY